MWTPKFWGWTSSSLLFWAKLFFDVRPVFSSQLVVGVQRLWLGDGLSLRLFERVRRTSGCETWPFYKLVSSQCYVALSCFVCIAQIPHFSIHYLRQGELGEHWRRLRLAVLSVVPYVCVYMMTHNSNDVIAPTAQTATLAITFSSLSPAAKLFLLPPFSLLLLTTRHLQLHPTVGCSCRW